METEKVITIREGTLAYVSCKGGVAIKRYRGIGTQATVPDRIEGQPVIVIEKKAFLSCKTLREIRLPDSVQEIGDWAFAHADQLRSVTVPRHELIRGKELFLGCKRLHEIRLAGTEQEQKLDEERGIGRMLAATVTILHDYFLFDPTQAGRDDWIGRWDEKLIQLIRLDDLDGFEELWTCGEEDYEGKDYDITSYPVEKRKVKIRMVYFRLLHPYKLSAEIQSELMNYLQEHTKGTKEPESWSVLIEEHPEDMGYYRIFTQAGCVQEDNFDALLADMQKVNAEMKAYLIRYKEEHFGQRDAFASFDLDW